MKFKTIFLILLVFSTLDFITTMIGIELGKLYEANPIANFFLSYGIVGGIVFVLIATISLSLVIYYFGNWLNSKYKKYKYGSAFQILSVGITCLIRIIASSRAIQFILN